MSCSARHLSATRAKGLDLALNQDEQADLDADIDQQEANREEAESEYEENVAEADEQYEENEAEVEAEAEDLLDQLAAVSPLSDEPGLQEDPAFFAATVLAIWAAMVGGANFAAALADAVTNVLNGTGAPAEDPTAPKGPPRPSPNFEPPTNLPQLPPIDIPDGWRVREMPPTDQYPDGYCKLEKPLPGGHWQPIDPSTMKPGTRPQTHVPFPPKGD